MSFLKYIRLCLFLVFTGTVFQTHAQTTEVQLKWYDWNEGYALALKEGKILLVDAYTDWCGWCKKMDRDTYAKEAVIKKINEHFIAVKFNPEITGSIYKIGEQQFTGEELYGVLTQGKPTGFPTTYYIYPAQKKLFYDAGYKGPEQFITVLDAAIQEGKK